MQSKCTKLLVLWDTNTKRAYGEVFVMHKDQTETDYGFDRLWNSLRICLQGISKNPKIFKISSMFLILFPFFFSYFVLLFRDLKMRMILYSVNHIVITVICVKLCFCFQFHSLFEVELILNTFNCFPSFQWKYFQWMKANRDFFLTKSNFFSRFLFSDCESVWLSQTRENQDQSKVKC